MNYSPWNSPGLDSGVGSLSLLQGIFPTQVSNRGLLHCRRILYQLSCEGSPWKDITFYNCFSCIYWDDRVNLGEQGRAWGLGAGVYLGGPEVQQVLKGLSQGAQLPLQAAVRVPNTLSLLRFQKKRDTQLACPPTISFPILSFPSWAGGSVPWGYMDYNPKGLFAQTTGNPSICVEPAIPVNS